MIVDLLIVCAVVLLGLVGMRTGTRRQLAHLAGMVLARFIAMPLALLMTLSLARDYGMPPLPVRVGFSAICFYGLYFFGMTFGDLFMKAPALHRRISRIDQTGGFVLGVVQGAVLVGVLLSVVHLFQGSVTRTVGRPARLLKSSRLFAFVGRQHRFQVPSSSSAARLERLVEAARQPRSPRLAGDPEFSKILDDPDMKTLLEDEVLARAIKTGDWSAVQADPRMEALLGDPRIRGSLADPLDYED